MIASGSAFARVGGLVFACVVLQVSGVSQVHVFGASANLVPLLVGAVALYAGSVPGAATGFATGLTLDVAAGHDMGASALVLTAVGYAVGRYREARDPAHELAPVPAAAAATAGYAIGFALVGFMLSTDAMVSALVLRDMLVTVALNTLLALPAFLLVRRVLRPVLAVDPVARRRRRRRARPVSPIGVRSLPAGER